LAFIQEARLDRVGAFAYSPVEGAAANELPGAVSEAVKQERLARFMEVQSTISANKLQERVGQSETVLVDEITSDAIYARSVAEAPEIDGVVIIEPTEDLELVPGDLIDVTIIGADEHDLFASTE
jgi:ribosomal protein S12 methylthiotransferase